MRKLLFPALLILALVVTACGGNQKSSGGETFTYESETGPVEVPKNPRRVVSLSGFTGNLMHLGVPVVGADIWSKNAAQFAEKLKDVEEASEENLEKLIELDPDLIIALSTAKNLDKIGEIAPTVTYTWGALDIFNMHIEIGKAVEQGEGSPRVGGQLQKAVGRGRRENQGENRRERHRHRHRSV